MMADMDLWYDRRLRLTLTRLGLEYLVVLALTGFFAVNSGNNLLYLVFSLMLGLFLVSGWVSRRALQGIVPLGIEEGNLFARMRSGVRVRLQDAHPRRPRGLEIHLELEHGTVAPGFLAGGDGSAGSPVVLLHASPDRRGWCRVRHLELRTRFPFGFLEKAWRFPLDRTLLVLPRPRPSAPADDTGRETRALPSGPGQASPDGARPFRTGDPLSRVHWKRTAQRGVPWIRTFEGEQPAGVNLYLDLGAWTPGEAFERELESLSGAILQARLHKREVSLSLRSREGLEEHAGPTACWRALALASAQGGQPLPGQPRLS